MLYNKVKEYLPQKYCPINIAIFICKFIYKNKNNDVVSSNLVRKSTR